MIGVFAAVIYLGAIASVVIRYRRSGVLERLQLKWLIAVVALIVTAQVLSGAFGSLGLTELQTIGFFMGLLSFALLPVAIGIAVLRYRLYEIDRIISRTLSWTVVTGVLVTVFVGVVVALQGLLAGYTQGQTLAVAGSTIVVFALFQPLRRRIQQAIDRRFDRSRYDARRMVEASPCGCATRWRWMRSWPTCTRRSAPRSGHRRSGCGCGRPAHEPAARRDPRAGAPTNRDDGGA